MVLHLKVLFSGFGILHHDRLKLCIDSVIPLWMRQKCYPTLDEAKASSSGGFDEIIAYDAAKGDLDSESG